MSKRHLLIISITAIFGVIGNPLAASANQVQVYSASGEACTIVGSSAANTLNGTPGRDVICGLGGNDTISGLGGNDVLEGGAGNDTLRGGAGNDLVIGGAGNDVMNGDAGTDTVSYQDVTSLSQSVTVSLENTRAQNTGTGIDTLTNFENLSGGSGNDTLTGNSLNNQINGNSGNDRISGGSGNDVLFGNDGNNNLFGDAGEDQLFGEWGADYLNGGSGNDSLYGNEGNDSLIGDSGNDYMVGEWGNDSLNGGSGNDQMYGGYDNDSMFGDIGDDTIWGDFGNDSLYGGSGNDQLVGGYGNDLLNGEFGTDSANYSDIGNTYQGITVNLNVTSSQTTGAGSDTLIGIEDLIGGSGDDTLTGNFQNNRLFGGGGDDTLEGREGNDLLRGDWGDDEITGGLGNDQMFGDSGIDTILYSDVTNPNQNLYINLANSYQNTGQGFDQISDFENVYGGAGSDQIYGNSLSNSIFGGGGNDSIWGWQGDDNLHGQAGSDYIYGGEGSDFIYGGDSNDYLVGDQGDDQLFGEAGSDQINGGDGFDNHQGAEGIDYCYLTFDENRDVNCDKLPLLSSYLASTEGRFNNWNSAATGCYLVYKDSRWGQTRAIIHIQSDGYFDYDTAAVNDQVPMIMSYSEAMGQGTSQDNTCPYSAFSFNYTEYYWEGDLPQGTSTNNNVSIVRGDSNYVEATVPNLVEITLNVKYPNGEPVMNSSFWCYNEYLESQNGIWFQVPGAYGFGDGLLSSTSRCQGQWSYLSQTSTYSFLAVEGQYLRLVSNANILGISTTIERYVLADFSKSVDLVFLDEDETDE